MTSPIILPTINNAQSQGIASVVGSKKERRRARRERKRLARSASLGGDAVDLNRTDFTDEARIRKGVLTNPGDERKIRGLNDFVSATNRFSNNFDEFQGVIDQRGLQDAIDKNKKSASESFDVAEGVSERRTRGLGIQETARQKRGRGRQFGLGRALADAQAGSSTRRQFQDRANAARVAAGGIEEGLRDIEGNALNSLSEAAGQQKVARLEKKEASKAATASLISSGIGAGLAIFSSEDYKHDKRPQTSLLDRLKAVRVDKWKYVGDETDHIGPYAEEFNDTFGVGADNKQMINLGDAVGVLMGSIKELNAKVEASA